MLSSHEVNIRDQSVDAIQTSILPGFGIARDRIRRLRLTSHRNAVKLRALASQRRSSRGCRGASKAERKRHVEKRDVGTRFWK
jgi:hypothetical protein